MNPVVTDKAIEYWALETDHVGEMAREILALRKQTALDAESRKASQEEFARLNRELNEARDAAQKLATMYDEACHSLGQARTQIETLRWMAGLRATGESC